MSIDENTPFTDPDQNDSENFFDLSQMKDAGESEESIEAEKAARQTVINMEHAANEREHEWAEAYLETDLVKRARILASYQAYDFVHFKTLKDDFAQIARTDSSMNRFAVLDALFDKGSGRVPYPHFDTFRGKFVDHHGEVFTSEKQVAPRELVEAMNVAGLDNPTERQVIGSYMAWAQNHKRDGLLHVFNQRLPKWDGTERLPNLLLELFKPFETKTNRYVSKYFWLSLYNRITNPGCLAPISIALIGGQNVGKSYFSELLCKTILGDPLATAIPLDFAARNYNDFLRDITGNSIVANVGEMTGFKKADIEAMKAFAAKSVDNLNFKFMDTMMKPRQWIIIMDGNEYTGLQRDDTGNRRFYPIFVAQEPDVGGQPNWKKEGFKVNFSNFETDVWQAMAECREWMNKHGFEGYKKFVDEVSDMVRDFNKKEMELGRGIVRDDKLDAFLMEILAKVDYIHRPTGWMVTTANIMRGFAAEKLNPPHARSLKGNMERFGYEQHVFAGSRGYILKFEEGKEKGKDLAHLLTKMFMKAAGTENTESYTDVRSRVIQLMNSGKDSGF